MELLQDGYAAVLLPEEQKLKKEMKNSTEKKEKLIPGYTWSPLIICLTICSSLYFITKYMGIGAPHDIESSIDRMIPFIPCWSFIYLLCYFFWGFNALLIAREGKEKWFRFVAAYVMAELFCCCIFIVFPTTMPRPNITGDGFSDMLMTLIYKVDLPYNLLPSIHCMLSWLVTRPLLRSDKVPSWYIVFSVINCFLIFLSTLFTKQHVLADIVTGVAVAEAAFFIAGKTGFAEFLSGAFGKLDEKLTGRSL